MSVFVHLSKLCEHSTLILKNCCKWGYHWKIFRLTLIDIHDTPIYFFQFFFYWLLLRHCDNWDWDNFIVLTEKVQEIFRFCEVEEATKKVNFKKHDIWVFFHCTGISLITILEAITGWRSTITFIMNTLKIGKKCVFLEVTSQKHHKLKYIYEW